MRKKGIRKAAAGLSLLLAVTLPAEQTMAAPLGSLIKCAQSGDGSDHEGAGGSSDSGSGGSGGSADSGSGSGDSGGSADSGSGSGGSGGSADSGSGSGGSGGSADSGSGSGDSGGSSNSGSGSGDSGGSSNSGSGSGDLGGSSNSGSGSGDLGGSSNSGGGSGSPGESADSGSGSGGLGNGTDSGSGNGGSGGSVNSGSGSGGPGESVDSGSGSGGPGEGTDSGSGNGGSGGSVNSGSGSGDSGGNTNSGSGSGGSGESVDSGSGSGSGSADSESGSGVPGESTDSENGSEGTGESESSGGGSEGPGAGGSGGEKGSQAPSESPLAETKGRTGKSPFGGEGTEEEPYLIGTAKELEKLADLIVSDYENYGSSCYRLTGNIKMKKRRNNHTPIGSAEQPFNGEFDGDGYVIEGLSIVKPKKEAQGLFAVIGEEGVVRNAGLRDNLISGQEDVGAIAGMNYGIIDSCFQTGEVYGLKNNIGTIAGRNSGTVSNCYSTGLAAGGYQPGDYAPELGGEGRRTWAGRGGFRDFIQTVAETIMETIEYVVEETKAGLETLYTMVTSEFLPDSTQLLAGPAEDSLSEEQTVDLEPEDSMSDMEGMAEGPGEEYDEEMSALAVGGLVGRNTGGLVENSYQAGSQAAKDSSWSVGGICGINHDGLFDNVYYIAMTATDEKETAEGVRRISSEGMTGEDAVERLGLEEEFWVGKATEENEDQEEQNPLIRYRHYYPQLTAFAERGQAHPYTLGIMEADGLRVESVGQKAYVSTEEGWNWLFSTEEYYSYTVILEGNLDLRGFGKSIGTDENPFTGILDGNGHVISGLRQPLFGVLGEGSAVYYLLVDQSEVTGTIVRTDVDGLIGEEASGILAGYAKGCVIDSCGAVGTMTLNDRNDSGRAVYAGGMIGKAEEGTSIYESYAFVNLAESLGEHADVTAGGLVGILEANAGADNCYATGRLDCQGLTGGFAGINRGEIRDSYVSTIIGNTSRGSGAFVGLMSGSAESGEHSGVSYGNDKNGAGQSTEEETLKPESMTSAGVSREPLEKLLVMAAFDDSGSLEQNPAKDSGISEPESAKDSGASEPESAKGTGGLEPKTTKGSGGLEPEITKGTGGLEPETMKGTGGMEPETTKGTGGMEPETAKGTGGMEPETTKGTGGLEPENTKGSGDMEPETTEGTGVWESEPANGPEPSEPESTNGTGPSEPESTTGPEISGSGPMESLKPSESEEIGPGIASTPSEAEVQPGPASQTEAAASSVREDNWIKQNGTITGCAYDSQMSGCNDLYAEPLQTVDMTGANAVLPGGDWYMTEDAYPQLKCMALHTEETYILRSKASVIPLILPMGINLNDIPKAGEDGLEPERDVKITGKVEVRIPEQIDGDSIQWTDPDRMMIQEDGTAVMELD